MFKIGFCPKQLWAKSEGLHLKRVLNLYIRRHRDDLLGLGYHQFMQVGRGVVILRCSYRDLFFRKGLSPIRQYVSIKDLNPTHQSPLLSEMYRYDPSTEIVVSLQVENMDLEQFCRLSKRGLSLSVIHRQYLNRLLDYVVAPGVAQPEGS